MKIYHIENFEYFYYLYDFDFSWIYLININHLGGSLGIGQVDERFRPFNSVQRSCRYSWLTLSGRCLWCDAKL